MSKPKPRQKIKCGRNWPFVNSFVEFAVCGNPIFSSHGTNTTVASENDLFLWLLAFPFPDKSSSKKIRFDHNDAKCLLFWRFMRENSKGTFFVIMATKLSSRRQNTKMWCKMKPDFGIFGVDLAKLYC